jgi:hypothetical protein
VREAIDAEPIRFGPRIKKLRGLLTKLDTVRAAIDAQPALRLDAGALS